MRSVPRSMAVWVGRAPFSGETGIVPGQRSQGWCGTADSATVGTCSCLLTCSCSFVAAAVSTPPDIALGVVNHFVWREFSVERGVPLGRHLRMTLRIPGSVRRFSCPTDGQPLFMKVSGLMRGWWPRGHRKLR